MWQIMGLLSDNYFHFGPVGQHSKPPFLTTTAYTVLTGAGDAFGVVLGHTLLSLFETKILHRSFTWSNFFKIGGALACGSCLSGGAWQGLADGCVNDKLSFNTAVLVVGLCCGGVFFMGLTTGRAVFALPRETWKDFTLAIACGCGSGFFVGTDSRYPNNWMQPVVGERTGDNVLDVVKAGLSVFLGFLCAQLLFCMCVQYGSLWTDAENTTVDAKSVVASDVAAATLSEKGTKGSSSFVTCMEEEEDGRNQLLLGGR